MHIEENLDINRFISLLSGGNSVGISIHISIGHGLLIGLLRSGARDYKVLKKCELESRCIIGYERSTSPGIYGCFN